MLLHGRPSITVPYHHIDQTAAFKNFLVFVTRLNSVMKGTLVSLCWISTDWFPAGHPAGLVVSIMSAQLNWIPVSQNAFPSIVLG